MNRQAAAAAGKAAAGVWGAPKALLQLKGGKGAVPVMAVGDVDGDGNVDLVVAGEH
jgi:hypothetical protein